MTVETAPASVDAVNWCHSPVLFQSQLAAAQWRCNINRTVELVVLLDTNNEIVEQRVIKPNREMSELAVNKWR